MSAETGGKPPTDTEEVLNKIDHRFIDILYEHVVDEDTRLRYEVHDSFLGLLDEQEEHQQLGGRRASMKKKMKKRRGIVRRFTRWVGNKVDQATEAVKKGAAKVRSWFVGAGKTIKGAAKDVMARANKAIEATRKKLELIFDALVGKPLAWLQEKLWNALLAWQKRAAVDKGKKKFLESAEGKAWKHSIELKLRRHQARTKFEGDKKYRVSAKHPYYGHAKCDDPRYANNKVKPIEGIADLHEHALSYLSFGGGYVHGKINGTLKEALPPCKGNDGHHGSFLSGTPFHRWRLNGWHEDPKKAFLGWPRFDTSSHVSSHLDWIKRAATRKDKFKLRFLTITAVHNEKLCILYRLFGRMPKSFIEGWKQSGYKMEEICADVPNIERQLKAAHEMAAENKDWMGIARSGKECRALASSGKLCVQLSIEVGDLCRRKNDVDLLHAYHYEDETPAACVKRLSDLGVRIAFLTHLRNNRWSAASFSTEFITTVHQWMARMHSENERRDAEGIDDKAVDLRADRGLVANLFKNIHRLFDMSSVLRSVRRAAGGTPFDIIGPIFEEAKKHTATKVHEGNYTGYHTLGLTKEGKVLVDEMFKSHWLLEMGHISSKARREIYEISKTKHAFSPLLASHSRVPEKATCTETDRCSISYYADFETLQMILETGGMVGLRHSGEFKYSKAMAWAPANCGGAHADGALQDFWVREIGVPVGYGIDLNGAAGQQGPRFYDPNRDPHGIFRYDACAQGRCHKVADNWMFSWMYRERDTGHIITGATAQMIKRAAVEYQKATSDECQAELAKAQWLQEFTAKTPGLNYRTGKPYDSRGVATIDDVTDHVQAMEQLGTVVDCPICLTRSAENAVRAWERADLDAAARAALPPLRPTFRPYAALPKWKNDTTLEEIGRRVLQTRRAVAPDGSVTAEHLWTDQFHEERGDSSMCPGGKYGGGGAASSAAATTTAKPSTDEVKAKTKATADWLATMKAAAHLLAAAPKKGPMTSLEDLEKSGLDADDEEIAEAELRQEQYQNMEAYLASTRGKALSEVDKEHAEDIESVVDLDTISGADEVAAKKRLEGWQASAQK
eukprot:g2831.t1